MVSFTQPLGHGGGLDPAGPIGQAGECAVVDGLGGGEAAAVVEGAAGTALDLYVEELGERTLGFGREADHHREDVAFVADDDAVALGPVRDHVVHGEERGPGVVVRQLDRAGAERHVGASLLGAECGPRTGHHEDGDDEQGDGGGE